MRRVCSTSTLQEVRRKRATVRRSASVIRLRIACDTRGVDAPCRFSTL